MPHLKLFGCLLLTIALLATAGAGAAAAAGPDSDEASIRAVPVGADAPPPDPGEPKKAPGIPGLDGPRGGEQRIVGGAPTTIEVWPWQVLLAWNDSIYAGNGYQRRWCGGSLVAPTIVVTAAHCLYNVPNRPGPWLPASELEVFSGRTVASSGQGQVIEVEEIYAFNDGSSQLFNPVTGEWDVAFLKLAAPSSSSTIQIAGPDETPTWSGGRTAFATGWGDTFGGSDAGSDTLLATQMGIVHDATCQDEYWGSSFYPEVMVCAGGPPSGGHDTCQGDSGGPLVVPVEVGFGTGVRLAGVTSQGDEGCGTDAPGMYARIGADPIRSALAAGVLDVGGVNPLGSGARPLAAPETTITKRPKKVQRTRKRKIKARFKFTASEPAVFQCSVDRRPYKSCSSPFVVKVKRKKHRFRVRAIDSLGKPDPEAASVKWKVKGKRRR